MILVNEMTSLLFMIAIKTNTHKFANLNTLKSSMKIPTRIPSPKLRNVRHKSDPFRPSFCVREFYIKKLNLTLENDKMMARKTALRYFIGKF